MRQSPSVSLLFILAIHTLYRMDTTQNMAERQQISPFFQFDWARIPGQDNKRLINHIERCFRLPWVKEATISKKDDKTIIIVPKGPSIATRKTDDKTTIIPNITDVISLKITEENCSVILEINGKLVHSYRIQRQNKEIRVCTTDIRCLLRMVDEQEEETVERLVKALQVQSWKNIQELVDISHSEDSEDSHKAALVLLSVGDLAISPILHSLRLTNPEEVLWELGDIIDNQNENRLQVAQTLEGLLGDTHILIEAERGESPVEDIPHQRVCDGAYLLLRRLLAFDESSDEKLQNELQYLRLPDTERDAEISRMKRSKRWISLTENP